MTQLPPYNQQNNRMPPAQGPATPQKPLQQIPPVRFSPPGLGSPVPPPRKQGKSLSGSKIIILVLLLAILAGGIVWGVNTLRDKQVAQSIAPYQDVYAPNIFINDVSIAGLTPKQAESALDQAMQERISSWKLDIAYQGFTFTTVDYGSLGNEVSKEEMYQLLNEAWLMTRQGSVHDQRAAIDALAKKPYKAYTSQKELQGNQLADIFRQIEPYVNAAPVDAALLQFRPDEDNPFVFQNERPGAKLDSQAAINDIMTMAASGQSGTYELKPEVLLPKITRAALEETVQLRSSVTTAISADSDEKRNHNIRKSFEKFNGYVLKPGETFSFNDIVGPRTEAAGFAEAMEYAYGDLVIGIGGGVCQASTTLYQAVVTAGMTIRERYPHSGKVDYTAMGQDATVYLTQDRNLDFRFRNNTPGNIYITARVKPARNNTRRLVSEIRVYGLDMGEGVTYKLRSETVEVLPAPTEKKYEVDNSGTIVTYSDQEKLKSKAVEGMIIETYLEKYQNGVLVEQPKLISRDTFRAKPAVYYRGATKRN